MKKIISLCLFGDDQRYWQWAFAAIINNRIVYPDFDIKIHIPCNNKGHIIIPALQALSNETSNLEIVFVDRPINGLESAFWRMLPIWNNDDIEVMLCRDVDAYPVTYEVKSTYYFISHNKYDIHGIRSCSSHGLCLMAGLCGFKVNKIKNSLAPSFDQYRDKSYYVSYGGDQEALTQQFYKDPKTKHLVTLDTPLGTAPVDWGLTYFKPIRVPMDEYDKVDISFIKEPKVIKWGDTFEEYAGMRLTLDNCFFLESLNFDIEISKDTKKVLLNNPEVLEYYKLRNVL